MRYLKWIFPGLYGFVYAPLAFAEFETIRAIVGVVVYGLVTHLVFISGIGIIGMNHGVDRQKIWGSIAITSLMLGVLTGLMGSWLVELGFRITLRAWYVLLPLMCVFAVGWGMGVRRWIAGLDRYHSMRRMTSILALAGGAVVILAFVMKKSGPSVPAGGSFSPRVMAFGFIVLVWTLLPAVAMIFLREDRESSRGGRHSGDV